MAKIQPRKILNVAEQEKALRELQAIDKKKKEGFVRITIDLPQGTHEQIKEEMNYTGQTIRGFVMMLVREYFENKQK